MGEKLEALWVVSRSRMRANGNPTPFAPFKVFRTRDAARECAMNWDRRSKAYAYTVDRATWGPEQ